MFRKWVKYVAFLVMRTPKKKCSIRCERCKIGNMTINLFISDASSYAERIQIPWFVVVSGFDEMKIHIFFRPTEKSEKKDETENASLIACCAGVDHSITLYVSNFFSLWCVGTQIDGSPCTCMSIRDETLWACVCVPVWQIHRAHTDTLTPSAMELLRNGWFVFDTRTQFALRMCILHVNGIRQTVRIEIEINFNCNGSAIRLSVAAKHWCSDFLTNDWDEIGNSDGTNAERWRMKQLKRRMKRVWPTNTVKRIIPIHAAPNRFNYNSQCYYVLSLTGVVCRTPPIDDVGHTRHAKNT